MKPGIIFSYVIVFVFGLLVGFVSWKNTVPLHLDIYQSIFKDGSSVKFMGGNDECYELLKVRRSAAYQLALRECDEHQP